jgi:hypothetical protein
MAEWSPVGVLVIGDRLGKVVGRSTFPTLKLLTLGVVDGED